MRRFLGPTALVVGGTLLGLLLAEVLLALFLPQPLRTFTVEGRFFGRFDPELGWANRENAEGFHQPNPNEPGGRVRINAQGLRGPNASYDKHPAQRRVLVLGDSITFGFGLDEPETYPFIVNQLLGSDYQVLNGGVAGYGIDQYLLWFRRKGMGFQPDIVLVGFSAGDIYDATCSLRHGSHKPFFRLTNGNLRLFNAPVPERVSVTEVFRKHPGPIRDLLFERFHLYRLLYYRLSDPAKALRDLDRPEMERMEGMRVSEAILQALKAEAGTIGARVVVLVVPDEDWIRTAAGGGPGSAVIRRGHAAAVRAAAAADIPVIDLWEPFLAHYHEGLFLKDDPVHPNARGNRLIAETVYRSGLLE